MERELTPEEKRQSQNIFGVIIIFVGIYMFFKQNADLLTLGITLIIGFGVSQDIRNVTLFGIKYVLAKVLKKSIPKYDFSHAKIKQKSKRDSVVNYGTIVYKK